MAMAVHAHIDMMITLRQNGSSANETGVYAGNEQEDVDMIDTPQQSVTRGPNRLRW